MGHKLTAKMLPHLRQEFYLKIIKISRKYKEASYKFVLGLPLKSN